MTDSPAQSGLPKDFRSLDLADISVRRQLSGPALRTFLNIVDLWGLSETQRLLVLANPPALAFGRWCADARAQRPISLAMEQLTRIAAILRIHANLEVLYPDAGSRLAWLRNPHLAADFAGRPPIACLTDGTEDGLLRVTRHLDAMRTGFNMPPMPGIEGEDYALSFADEIGESPPRLPCKASASPARDWRAQWKTIRTKTPSSFL